MAGAAVAWLLPESVTGRLMGLTQVLVPLHDGAGRVVEGATGWLEEDKGQDLRSVLEGMEHRIAFLTSRNASLVEQNERLTQLRDMGIGGRLIPASIRSQDVLAWRRSRLIDRGSLRGVQRENAVLSREFSLPLSSRQQVSDGVSVLSAESLVGVAEQVGPYASRVRLLTDPATRLRVRVTQETEEGQVVLPVTFLLEGAGAAGMVIREVDHRFVRERWISVGSIVVTEDDPPNVPGGLTVGRVSTATADRDNMLIYTLAVVPVVDYDGMDEVFVYDPSGA